MKPHCIVAAVIVSTFAAACSPDTSAAPSPATTTGASSTTSRTSGPSEPARPTTPPPVIRTLDLPAYRGHPCDLLTREQQAELNLPQPESRGSLCRWSRDQPKLSVSVDLLIDLNYLTQVYLQSNQENSALGRKEWVVFDPTTVGGQPAVVLNATTQQTASGVLVATSPDDSIDITVTIEPGDPRATAIAIAEHIVGNLK